MMTQARLPEGRTTTTRVQLLSEAGQSQYATLLAGMAIGIVEKRGTKLLIDTRGPVRIRGLVPTRSVGLCVKDQAPVRIKPEDAPVGHIPKGWCFRILRETPKDLVFTDSRFGLPFYVEHRHLADQIQWQKRFQPLRAGFVSYRLRDQPMRRSKFQGPYFIARQGEWPIRVVYQEGRYAQIEVQGEVVVLQGWEKSTHLFADLFRKPDELKRARASLAKTTRVADRRPWFFVRTKTPLFRRPGGKRIGEIDANVRVTVNRRSGKWSQLRIEPKGRAGRHAHRMDTRLWVQGDVLAPLANSKEERPRLP